MLLGTSPSLDGIKQVIRAFYCMKRDGEVTLEPTSEGVWSVTTHKPLPNVRVVLVKGRYRFEGASGGWTATGSSR